MNDKCSSTSIFFSGPSSHKIGRTQQDVGKINEGTIHKHIRTSTQMKLSLRTPRTVNNDNAKCKQRPRDGQRKETHAETKTIKHTNGEERKSFLSSLAHYGWMDGYFFLCQLAPCFWLTFSTRITMMEMVVPNVASAFVQRKFVSGKSDDCYNGIYVHKWRMFVWLVCFVHPRGGYEAYNRGQCVCVRVLAIVLPPMYVCVCVHMELWVNVFKWMHAICVLLLLSVYGHT